MKNQSDSQSDREHNMLQPLHGLRDGRSQAILEELKTLGNKESLRNVFQELDTLHTAVTRMEEGLEEDTPLDTRVAEEYERQALAKLEVLHAKQLQESGYVHIKKHWLHHSLISFTSMTLVAVIGVPFSVQLLFSTKGMGWLWGGLGLITTIIVEAILLKKLNLSKSIKH